MAAMATLSSSESHEVRLLPLLIGPSDTLTKAMPESAKKVSALQVIWVGA